MSKHTISNDDDVIDSRDVIERIQQLKDEIEAAEANADGFSGSQVGGPDDPVDADTRNELAKLEAFAEEGESAAPDWKYGETLIRDDYFTEYAQELVSDIGDLPKNIPGYLVIDWDQTAENIQQDYTSVEWDGVTYWVR